LAGTSISALSAVATPYVFILAVVGPVLARFTR
jgi:CPA2 family monovalent cation:H+ antiporter-2